MDQLENIFNRWNKETITEDQMKLLWGNRNRKLLEGRFDVIQGIAEGDFLMGLVERGGGSIQRHQYITWRTIGLAFRIPDVESSLSEGNITLLTGNRELSYEGDIITGPFISHGMISNTKWSVQDEVPDSKCFTEETFKSLETAVKTISLDTKKSSITLLSPGSAGKLNFTKLGIENLWIGVSMTHILENIQAQVCKNLWLETPLYLLQVETKLLPAFIQKVCEMASKFGFKFEKLLEESDQELASVLKFSKSE
ncbi:dynein assembly factor 3, axonemal [Eurytemora carolleeae]|uniref:dynein assembly factor 3, axonemal n=1 Tax=Eurytemora carolleeae TaxID=1294199 RepID=UPI000C7726CE|nr:dynein assembly factor 3, axonemal [Eurytemora carolleeae]|eukprot:XP_023327672.1 dynein assembly factor 3, axonemal-like [Eurytemora affinis]